MPIRLFVIFVIQLKTINIMKISRIVHTILLFILFLGFVSCSSDDNDIVDNTFSGRYKVVSILSDKKIDLNNDGRESEDLLNEMSDIHKVTVVLAPPTYDPNSMGNYAEVRPLNGSTNDARLIDFNYPCQVFIYEAEGDYSVMTYLSRFNNYSYEYTSDGQIEIIDNVPDFNTQYGTVNKLVKINDDSFSINMTINLYNFKAKEWVKADVKVVYEKVNIYQ